MSDESQLELGAGAKEAIRQEVAEKITGLPSRRLYGTFAGVFTPTLLTILGVIMYLREGWVVGNAGLLGACAIILFSYLITISTGLSLASITTNIRIGAGGAFSVISQSSGACRRSNHLRGARKHCPRQCRSRVQGAVRNPGHRDWFAGFRSRRWRGSTRRSNRVVGRPSPPPSPPWCAPRESSRPWPTTRSYPRANGSRAVPSRVSHGTRCS